MKLFTTIIAAFALPVMALSFIAFSNEKKINAETKTVVAVASNSDTLTYYYQDASLAPEYRRNYLIRVTPGQVYLLVDSYNAIILEESFVLTKAAYDSFITALDNLHIQNRKEVKGPGCSGGTSERLILYPGSSREVKGYVDYCGGTVNGSLEGDLMGATILFSAIVPDLYKRIDATIKDD